MSEDSREFHVLLDGKVLGSIDLGGDVSFRTMARAALKLPGLREELQQGGVAGWGFDGGNFYITTLRKKIKAFSANFQWYLAPMETESQKGQPSSNPFEDLL